MNHWEITTLFIEENKYAKKTKLYQDKKATFVLATLSSLL